MATDSYRRVLELASTGGLPDQVGEDTPDVPLFAVRELVDAGYLTAINVSTFGGEAYMDVKITLAGREYLAFLLGEQKQPTVELIATLELLRDLMVSVATGGQRIESANAEYKELYGQVDQGLSDLGIENPIPFRDLWDWYGRWSSGEFPSYQSRRQFLSQLFGPLIDRIRKTVSVTGGRPDEPTGWPRVDRAIAEIRRRLAEATAEEQFQAVGLLCREAIISLAQAVHDPSLHPSPDGTTPSATDAKRMLEAYIAAELIGSSNEAIRGHAKAAYKLAVELQHKRTATFREAALCAEAMASLTNVIAIVSGRRDRA